MKTISYAITVCNEYEEIQKLIPLLVSHINDNDEIVVLFDEGKGTKEVFEYLKKKTDEGEVELFTGIFENHFANWKNLLNEFCSNDYIFQIDADELPSKDLLLNLPYILESNDVDILLIPRVNTVEGITTEHIQKWGWNVDDRGRINFPDFQWRVYRNVETIKWINKVHERLDGFKTYAPLPAEELYCLFHPKQIDRQEQQNLYYSTL